MRLSRNLPASMFVLLLLASGATADEAIRTDGRRVPGTLAVDGGRLRFTPKGQTDPLPFDAIRSVRLEALPPSPFRVGVVHVVSIRSGERLTGELLGLDAETLRLRTPWADKITLPRASVAALTHPPGFLTQFADDFRAGAKAWTISGKPGLVGAAVLSEPGQSLAHVLAKPLVAGRVGVNFIERDKPTGARWLFEAEFLGEKEPRRLSVFVAGSGDSYRVETQGIDGIGHEVARTPALHRLTLRFSPYSIAVLCDDAVLWHNLEHGPGGPLRQLRLACLESEKGAAVKGSVAWSDFAVAAAVDEPPRPPGDPTQDEILLADGDQLFGDVLMADRMAVVLKARFGERSLPWSSVRGCFFRKAMAAPRPVEGERVRLLLHAPFGGEPDVLDGVVTRIDDKAMSLRHALLGEVVVERGRVKEVWR